MYFHFLFVVLVRQIVTVCEYCKNSSLMGHNQ